MIMTLQMNGMDIDLSEEELYDAITTIACDGGEERWEYFKSTIIKNIHKKLD